MDVLRDVTIRTGFGLLRATRLHRLAGRGLQGLGAILMFHHVRPFKASSSVDYAPNGQLEITPAFLDEVIRCVRKLGFEIVTLDEAIARVEVPSEETAPFVVLSFDDGYRDNRDYALPILKQHSAPFTLFITSGFAERRARLWWLEMEEAIRRASSIDLEIAGERILLRARTGAEKSLAFKILYQRLRAGPEEILLDKIDQLSAINGVERSILVDEQCMDWDEIVQISREPLCTIGAHTDTHPMLAKHSETMVRHELTESRAAIERRIGSPVSHLAYPVGDAGSAGTREFVVAAESGFVSAVTTRPGMIFSGHAEHKTALPRLSINGKYQEIICVEALLTGAPFWVWNRGRALNID